MKKLYKRTIYLFYYMKQMDWKKYFQFVAYASKEVKKSKMGLILDSIASVYSYNIGLLDFFYFNFYKLDRIERNKYMGTGFKYEYDLIMNPISERSILQNKLEFFKAFHPFIKHGMCRIEDLESNNNFAKTVLNNPTGKVAVKDAMGQCGWGVEILSLRNYSRQELIQYMKSKGFNMVEVFINQHENLAQLSDSGLNTVRIITQLNADDEVIHIAPTLRITVNSPVDNMAMGNLAAPIDIKTGEIIGNGVYQDITKSDEAVHPITKVPILGFKIPFWNEVLRLTKEAALYNTKNRSIGWDVAISNSGPSLLEGNHNWCKLVWQLPLKKGMKAELEKYKEEYLKKIKLQE